MATLYLDRFDKEPLTALEHFSEYTYTESLEQHGFSFIKNNRKLYVYIGCKSGIHSAHLMVDDEIVSVLSYYNSDSVFLYNQSLYFEHKREDCYEQKIEVDTENLKINISLLDNLSPATNDWLDASVEIMESQQFRVLKNGISCTSEANRGEDVFYRCLFCETMIASVPKDSVSCKCRSLSIDTGMFRFYVKDLEKIQILQRTRQEKAPQ